MKTIFATLTLFGTLTAFGPGPQLNLGDKAPLTDLKMTDINGKFGSLSDLKGKNGLCVIFSCNTCPYVVAWEDRYNAVAQHCAKNNIGFVLINSNEAKRNGDDSMEAMQAHAKEAGYDGLNYMLDTNHKLADAFGATKTPDVFLFNGQMELTYKGAIDDNHESAANVKVEFLKQAVTATAAGQKADPGTTKAIGCSIKRVS